jgi:uncharacterized membrane protein
MKYLLLCIVLLLASVAGAQTYVKATEPDTKEFTAEDEAKAFAWFKEVAKACRAAGGCLIVTERAAERDLKAAFQAGVQQGQTTCGNGSL